MDPRELIGKTVQGRYVLRRVIGEGGMGAVFEAEHTEIGRKLAVKLVHGAHARDEEFVARFKREARATGMVESENIVQVFDAGEDEAVGLFIAMELLSGENLERRLAREKMLEPRVAVTVAQQAARGLARAHARGIVHRDLKPANVVLLDREDGTMLVKVVDFGIAKLVQDANDGLTGPSLTRVGGVVGTPQYMSPEQAQGLSDVDARSDIYSLGALLFEMLTGEPPIPALPTYEQKIVHIVTQPPRRASVFAPALDPELDALVLEMMAPSPKGRPADMQAVLERLNLFLVAGGTQSGVRSSVEPPAPPVSVERPPSSNRTLLGTGNRTDVAVTVERPPLADELRPLGIPEPLHRRWVLRAAGAAALLFGVWGMSRSSSRSEPSEHAGIIQSSPSSPIASVAPLPAPVLLPLPSSDPMPPAASPAPAARPSVPFVAGTSAIVRKDAGSSATTTSTATLPTTTDAGRVFGGAGLSNEF